MHSSELRGHDFQIRMSGEEIAHHDFFAGTRTTDRLGIVSPGALDGLGATAFILASVTAFYDAVRSEAAGTNTSSFRTYPEFYSFQLHPPCAAYGMLDIWPDHKDVPVTGAHPTLAQSVIDRSIHTLLLPACVPSSQESGSSREPDPKPYDEVHVASLQRAIRHAYLYDATGQMDDADLLVSCPTEPVDCWVAQVAATIQGAPSFQWPDPTRTQTVTQTVTQSLRRISPAEAIVRLAACEHDE